MSECSSDRTDMTVVEVSWPLLEEMAAGVLDLWWELLLEGILLISLPPLGIVNVFLISDQRLIKEGNGFKLKCRSNL